MDGGSGHVEAVYSLSPEVADEIKSMTSAAEHRA